MDRAAPSAAPRHPDMPDLMAEIWHVVQDLPVFLTAPLYRRWHLRWGATAAEATAELPGDTLVPAAQYRSTRAITIDAPASEIWPWLVQVGCLRGGFYSDDLLDNLAHPSATTIIPELQHLEVGQLIPMSPPGRTSERTAFSVHSFRVNEWLLWSKPDSTWAWSLTPTDTGLVRLAAPAGRDGRRAADGVRRLRHAPADAAWHQGTRGIRPQGPARKPGRQVRGVGL